MEKTIFEQRAGHMRRLAITICQALYFPMKNQSQSAYGDSDTQGI